jgi:hypothetical protein
MTWATRPSTRAIQASPTVIATARFGTSAPTPTPIAAKAVSQSTAPVSVCRIVALPTSRDEPRAESQAAVTATATTAVSVANTNPSAVYVTSFAPITRARRGVARNVSVIVRSRYSPATAMIPRTRVSSEVRPTWVRAIRASIGSSPLAIA